MAKDLVLHEQASRGDEEQIEAFIKLGKANGYGLTNVATNVAARSFCKEVLIQLHGWPLGCSRTTGQGGCPSYL